MSPRSLFRVAVASVCLAMTMAVATPTSAAVATVSAGSHTANANISPGIPRRPRAIAGTGATSTVTATPTPTAAPSPTPTPTPTPTATPTPTPPPSGFVTRSGTSLMLNGSRYRFTGFNMPYQMHDGESLSTALTDWGTGQTVARIFAFQTFNIVSGAINWTAMDALLATFASHGKKVILVLGNTIADSTNDDGATHYLSWWQGGYATQVQSTSVPPQVVTYREYVRQIVTRYASNPTIAMWQLVNEASARNPDNSCTDATALTAEDAFSTDVGGLIKSIDSNHLISLGAIQYGCGSWGTRYTTLYSNPYIDVCDYHDYTYPFSIGDPSTDAGFLATVSHCATDNKPLMVGEMGIDWTATPAYGQPAISPNTLAERATLLQAKVSAQFAAGVVGICQWTWRNSPATPYDGGDYGYEVGPGDPSLSVLGAF